MSGRPGISRAGPGRAAARFRGLAAAGLLAAVTIAWAGLPTAGAKPGIRLVLIAAIGCAAASLGALALGETQLTPSPFDPVPVQLAVGGAHVLRALPWTEAMTVAVIGAEALHPARPWHTGVLGAALLAYLFAAHLAETGAGPGVLAPQRRVLAAGLGLLVLAIGAAALPVPHDGPAATTLRVLAIAAAVVAAALAVPLGSS